MVYTMICPGFRKAQPEDAVSIEHIRSAEINGVYLGIPLLLLMENAGRAVANAIECRIGDVKGKRVHVLAGKGGNAGDGFVAARHLANRGARVFVHLSSRPEEVHHKDAKLNLEALLSLDSVKILKHGSKGWLDLEAADVIIDAMLGIGVKGRLRGTIGEMARAANNVEGLKVAIDTPTGLDPESGNAVPDTFIADLTVTMGWAKKGFFKEGARLYTGEILIAEIGLPREAEEYAGLGDVLARLPARPKDAHKGIGGRVLVVAGSKYYVGAALLAAGSAARSGVDLVYLASPKEVAVRGASEFSSVIPVPFEGEILTGADYKRLSELMMRMHSILIGPGLGLEEETKNTVLKLIDDALSRDIPIVIDADGIKALAERGEKLSPLAVLTPHRGEAKLLSGLDAPPESHARKIASEYNVTVLVKAPVDVACTPQGFCRKNRSGVPAMSVGGTGDVLSGLIAGFLARRKSKGLDPDPLNSAITAAFVAGRAGELAYAELGELMTAKDVMNRITKAIGEAKKYAE